MKSLNFNNVKKSYLNVTLADGTVLLIGTPTKRIFEELITIKDKLSDITSIDNLGVLFDICAVVMSHNKTGKEITRDYLEEIYDFEDIILFFKSYLDFVNEIKNEKN